MVKGLYVQHWLQTFECFQMFGRKIAIFTKCFGQQIIGQTTFHIISFVLV